MKPIQRYLAALCLFLVLPLGACRSGGVEINVLYERISGLTVDDAVVMRGGRVGAVASIQYTREGSYSVQLNLDDDFVNAFTEHAQFFIVDDPGGSGKKAVEIRHVQDGGRLMASGTTVDGEYESGGLSRRLQKEIEAGVRQFKKTFEDIGRDIQGFGDSEAYREMKKSLEGLAEEMARKEKAARERLKRHWLPRIQRELEDLREKLRQKGREDDMAPLDGQLEHLRRI